MYRVDGSSDLVEETLDHWEGYRRLRAGPHRQRRRRPAPARHLRRAARLDLAGRPARAPGRPPRLDQARPAHRLAVRATGTSPMRASGRPAAVARTSPTGALMCWVALDRMVRLAREHGRPADLVRWISERDRIYEQIMAHGWNPQRGGLHPARQDRGAGRLAADDAADRLRRPQRPDVAVDPGRDGRRAGVRQPGVPLQPQRLPRRAARRRGDLLDLHLLVRRRPGPFGAAGTGPADLREDVHLRQPPRACTPRRSA